MTILTVIVPVYNETNTIVKIIDQILKIKIKKQIIVVDDCSTDGSKEKIIKNKRKINKIIFHKKNLGKGAAIRTAQKYIKGKLVIIQDADLEYDPKEYYKLTKPIIDGNAEVVYGSRFIGGDERRILFFWHTIANKLLTLLSNMFTNLNLTDMETCYKLFKTDIIQGINLKEKRFGFEPEVTAKISRIPNIRIYEVGISYYGRTYDQGKKIGWKDGFRAIYCILKYGLLKIR